MKLKDLINNESSFSNAETDIQNIMNNVTATIFLKNNIKKSENDIVTLFGCISDRDNYAAVRNWIYNNFIDIDTQSQDDLISKIDRLFKNKLEAALYVN